MKRLKGKLNHEVQIPIQALKSNEQQGLNLKGGLETYLIDLQRPKNALGVHEYLPEILEAVIVQPI